MRIVLLALVTLVLVAPVMVYVSPDMSDPIDSVVMIYNDYGHGSGAIIGPSEVLTAGHVADDVDLVVRTFDGDEHKVVRIQKDPDSDLARLYIEGEFDEPPLTFDRTPLRVGDEITAIGTPRGPLWMNCVLTGRVVKVDVNDLDYGYSVIGKNMDVLDCHAAPGCSGAPVLDAQGRVRAVLVGGCEPLCWVVPVEELD